MTVTAAQVKRVVKAVSDIIHAQEGNYGSINENDNNHGMSIGKCQWNAYWGHALPLLQTIVNADEIQAKELLGDNLYKEIADSGADAWNKKKRVATEEEARALSTLLSSIQGKKAQDELTDADITVYVKNGVKSGIVSLKALAYYADLEDQGGSGTSKRIAQDAGEASNGVGKVGLEEIHAYALKDSIMGRYASRRSKVYEAVKASKLTDVSNGHGNIKTLTKGDTVTFIGGGVYISSTAHNEAKNIDKTSMCKVTAVNLKGSRPYHLISQDGKGVYGWVNSDSIKEVSTTAQDTPKTVSKGNTVTFTGGGVYISSTAHNEAKSIDRVSTCRVTAINTKDTHPYHCISQDGMGVYGWVDAADVK